MNMLHCIDRDWVYIEVVVKSFRCDVVLGDLSTALAFCIFLLHTLLIQSLSFLLLLRLLRVRCARYALRRCGWGICWCAGRLLAGGWHWDGHRGVGFVYLIYLQEYGGVSSGWDLGAV
jgi:hypothetical protein